MNGHPLVTVIDLGVGTLRIPSAWDRWTWAHWDFKRAHGAIWRRRRYSGKWMMIVTTEEAA